MHFEDIEPAGTAAWPHDALVLLLRYTTMPVFNLRDLTGIQKGKLGFIRPVISRTWVPDPTRNINSNMGISVGLVDHMHGINVQGSCVRWGRISTTIMARTVPFRSSTSVELK
jgi:hypothetical protein